MLQAGLPSCALGLCAPSLGLPHIHLLPNNIIIVDDHNNINNNYYTTTYSSGVT